MGNANTPANTFTSNTRVIPPQIAGELSKSSDFRIFGKNGTHLYQPTSFQQSGKHTKYKAAYIPSTTLKHRNPPHRLWPQGNTVICNTIAITPATLNAAPICPGVIPKPPSSTFVEHNNGNN